MDTFLEQSRTFMRAMTDSYSFINTARAGLDMLSEQVKRVVDAGANDDVITALYAMPDGVSGRHLRLHALRSQETKDRELAEMWLMTVFSRYESWAESLAEYGIAGKRGCQFPEPTSKGPGYIQVFSSLQPSQLMEDIYGDSARADRFWIPSDADAQRLLRLYRYYKEIRNSLVHADGTANAVLAQASAVANQAQSALQLNQPLQSGPIPVLAVKDPIQIDRKLVRDVIDLLHRLVFTIDARILMSTIGFNEFARRWREKHGTMPVNVLPQALNRPDWFSKEVSAKLQMPLPILAGSNDKKWPEPSRQALVAYGTSNWMIRALN